MNNIENLSEYAKGSYDYSKEVMHAWQLGVRHRVVPPEAPIRFRYEWEREPFKSDWEMTHYSDDGKQWHELYRQFRSKGWKRVNVKRDGGNIYYLMSHKDDDLPMPEVTLLIKISIASCKQVQVGTEEVPVYETRCEDLEEPIEEDKDIEDILVSE